MKRSLIILLIAAMLLPCLFLGCDNQEPEATTPVVTTPEVTTPETTTPEEEIVEPPYDGPDITPEGVLKRASVVTTGTSESELYAAQELAKYLSMKKIEVKDGAIFMADSTCADHLCVSQGKMSPENYEKRPMLNWIICLPVGIALTVVFILGLRATDKG